LASISGWTRYSLVRSAAEAERGVASGMARIASLLLRDLMSRGSPQCAFAAPVCWFSGRRLPVDGELLVAARDAITDAALKRRIVLAEKKIAVRRKRI
jgi:hypothetical protein